MSTITSTPTIKSRVGAMLRATSGSLQLTNVVTVSPLLSFMYTLTSVQGGTTTTATILLNASAPAGGVTVGLSSNNAVAWIPASVFIPAGAARATVNVATTAVGSPTPVLLTATLAGASTQWSLTVTP